MYSFVQSFYWNVGPFNYYTFQQLPNFILASPALFLSVTGIYDYVKGWGREGSVYHSAAIAPHVLHWLFVVLVCFVVLHIQVSTRFIASQCAPFYWFAASKLPVYPRAIVCYFLGYYVLGAVLFTNFYPWT